MKKTIFSNCSVDWRDVMAVVTSRIRRFRKPYNKNPQLASLGRCLKKKQGEVLEGKLLFCLKIKTI